MQNNGFDGFCAEFGFENLNPVQKQAVQCVEGNTLLFAVPGSGKTTVITARTGYMIHRCGIPGRNILVLTFTRAAANEMKERYFARFGKRSEGGDPSFRTIHSCCYNILVHETRTHGQQFPQIQNSIGSIIYSIARELYGHQEQTVIDQLGSMITYTKNRMLNDEEIREMKCDIAEEIDFARFYRSYQAYMEKNALMDMDDMLVAAYRILQSDAECLRSFRERYRYISVDEAQDTSPLQHRIIELLSGTDGNLFMVGDDDQSIYGFRGADPRELLDFAKRFRDATILTMNINYRTDTRPMELADRFISNNRNRSPKHMVPSSSDPGDVRFLSVPSAAAQYLYIAELVCSALEENETVAVLYRNNESALPLIRVLETRQIDYCVLGGIESALKNRMIANLIRLLKLSLEPRRFDIYRMCYSCLGLYLGADHLQELAEACDREPDQPVLSLLERLTRSDEKKNKRVRETNEALQAIAKMPPDSAVRVVTCKFLTEQVKNSGFYGKYRVYIMQTLAQQFDEIPDLLRYLDRISDERLGTRTSGLTLSTLHSCKGMEFDRVIMLDMLDQIIPGEENEKDKKRAIKEDREESARLFYVGATRARHELSFVSPERYPEAEGSAISRYVTFYRKTAEKLWKTEHREPTQAKTSRFSIMGRKDPQVDLTDPEYRYPGSVRLFMKRGWKDPGYPKRERTAELQTVTEDCEVEMWAEKGFDFRKYYIAKGKIPSVFAGKGIRDSVLISGKPFRIKKIFALKQ